MKKIRCRMCDKSGKGGWCSHSGDEGCPLSLMNDGVSVSSNSLLCCPICGQKAETAELESGVIIIGCVGEIACLLNLGIVGIEFKTKEDAAEMWNLRAT